MATKVDELIQHLYQLHLTNFGKRAKTRGLNVNVEAALSIVFDIGCGKIRLTDRDRLIIANELASTIRPIQASIKNQVSEFNPKIHSILKKRSALQFLHDDFVDFCTVESKLSQAYVKMVIQETIFPLDDVIAKHRQKSAADKRQGPNQYSEDCGSESEDDSENDFNGIPDSHIWWF